MIHSTSILQPRSVFDTFLFAPVGDDEKGMAVSVLSALARLEIDPWQEAAKLANLPTHAARVELANAIAKLPDVPRARTDPEPIADRLIALLPPNERGFSEKLTSPLASLATNRSSKRLIIMLFLVAIALGSYVSAVSVVAAFLSAATPPINQKTDVASPAFDHSLSPL